MRESRLWQRALGLGQTVVEQVSFDDAVDALVVAVRPVAKARGRCGRCGRRSPGYDRGDGRRRWRASDMGTIKVFIQADAPRVRCRVHGPTVAQVPWARHGAGHTRDFDDQVAWLAVQCSKTAVVELLRIAWRTVGAIIARVNADIDARVDRLAGLSRIGIDEISYKRGEKFLTVVVDHDTGRLVWAAPGRDDATLGRFFDALGPQRCAQITHVSADGAPWIARVVVARCPDAVRCADAFHVVRWATDALDEVRRQAWNRARGGPNESNSVRSTARAARRAHPLKKVRYALWKNPDRLTHNQHRQLEWVAKTDPTLWRAYLLKEALRHVFGLGGDAGTEALTKWLWWASHSRIPAFVDLARKIRRHRGEIEATLTHGLSNGLVEATNARIRVLTRVAWGFHGPEPLIALALLALGGHRPTLPGRN